MSILLRVVDRGSFSAASQELGIPIATVSRKVQQLEEHLGTRLLLRSTRHLSLTEAGTNYVQSARRILDQIEESERAAVGDVAGARGEILLTAPVGFGRMYVLPIVTEFLASYPEINVRLLLSDRRLHLLEEHVDLAFRIGPLPDSTMVATRIGSMRMVLCASPEWLSRYGLPPAPEALSHLPVIRFESLSPTSTWVFRDAAERFFEVPIHPRLSVTTAEAAVWAASQGVGITRVLHYQCAEELAKNILQILLPQFEPDPLPVHLLHLGQGLVPQKVRLFRDIAVDRLRQRLYL